MVHNYGVNVCRRKQSTVLGIYLPNGIFAETGSNCGISYSLDHLVYEKLAQCIEDTGSGMVRATTRYGYSSFCVICSPEMAQDNLQILLDELSQQNWQAELAEVWIEQRKKQTRQIPVPADTLYYAKRVPGSPLAKTLSGGLGRIPTPEEFAAWHKCYFKPENYTLCVSGFPVELPHTQLRRDARACNLPQYYPMSFGLPKQIPWRRSHMVLGLSCPLAPEDILAGEALCQWLRPQLTAVANNLGARLLQVQICPEFVSEIQISLQCAARKEKSIAEEIMNCLRGLPLHPNLELLRKEVFSGYVRQWENPLAWNALMGEVAMLYGMRIEDSLDYEIFRQSIEQEKLSRLFGSIISCESPCLFATAVR